MIVCGQPPTSEDAIVVSVIEYGGGMPPEVRDRLFTKHAISTKQGGTGLGTKIVKDVVAAHGERSGLKVELGAGTKIHIRLPRAPGESDLFHNRVEALAIAAEVFMNDAG